MFNLVQIKLEPFIDSVKLDERGSEFGLGLDSMEAYQQKFIPDKKNSNKHVLIRISICRWHIFNVRHFNNADSGNPSVFIGGVQFRNIKEILRSGTTLQQECIPIGCVPPAAVAVGVSASVHAGIPPSVCLETPWMWAWRPARHAGIPPPWKPAARHAGIPPAMHAGIPPPVNRITDTCENITLPQLCCGR